MERIKSSHIGNKVRDVSGVLSRATNFFNLDNHHNDLARGKFWLELERMLEIILIQKAAKDWRWAESSRDCACGGGGPRTSTG